LAPGKTETREFPLPEVGDDDALMRVEAAGVCGSDWLFFGGVATPGRKPPHEQQPRIQGHENVGRIARIGERASRRWAVKEGDRVAVEEFIPCGNCRLCRTGNYRLCDATDATVGAEEGTYLRYGGVPIKVPPALWGGYSQYQYLHPNSLIYKIKEDVPSSIAPLFIPLSNGIRWTTQEAGVGVGGTVVVQGPGQHGLGCVVAARAAGAACIIVAGLSKDERRLEVARRLGATHTVVADTEDLAERVREITAGEMADAVILTAGGAAEAVAAAPDLLRKLGVLILAGASYGPVASFPSSKLQHKELTLKGVRGHDVRSVEPAIALIESQQFPLELMCTHTFALNEVAEAISTVGEREDEDAIHVTVLPWKSQ
jgi:threonine dehydrogenase-like Zn-dependent dehydrogenase